MGNLGFLLWSQGKFAEAEPIARETLELRRRVLGEDHPDTLISVNNMGSLLRDQGRYAEAETYCREALERRRRVLGEGHPFTINSIYNMGSLLRVQGKLVEAEPYLREVVETSRRVLGEEHPDTLISVLRLTHLQLEQGNAQDALDLIAPCEPAARTGFTGGDTRWLADFLTAFARARVGVGLDAERFTLAESNLLEAHPIYLADEGRGPGHKDTLECVQALVDLYTAWHAAEPSNGHDAKAAEWRSRLAIDESSAP